MTRTKQIVVAVLLFGSCCFGQSSPNATTQKPTSSSPAFSLAVDPPAGPIRLGSPVNVTATLTNITTGDINLSSDKSGNGMYTDFTYSLTKDGHEAETTYFDRKITGRQRADDLQEVGAGSSILLPHQPGKVFVWTIDIKKLYQITEPGSYTFEVSRFDEYSKTVVRSKTVTLNMVP